MQERQVRTGEMLKLLLVQKARSAPEGLRHLNTRLHAVAVDGVLEMEVASDGIEQVNFHALPIKRSGNAALPEEVENVVGTLCHLGAAWPVEATLDVLAAAECAEHRCCTITDSHLISMPRIASGSAS